MSEDFVNRWAAALEGQVSAESWVDLDSLLAGAGLHAEVPSTADDAPGTLGRRQLLSLVGASAALAGLGGCTRSPDERIVPYVKQPSGVVPGIPQHYATSLLRSGFAVGVLVESREGRPVKVEGNPDHPASLGGTGAFEQASLLDLYDPQRARVFLNRGKPAPVDDFAALFDPRRRDPDRGRGLHLVLEPTTSPLVRRMIDRLRNDLPEAALHFARPLASPARLDATRAIAGRPLAVTYDLTRAETIVSLDDDFLCHGPATLRYARDFAARRRVRSPDGTMNRLYVVEAPLTVTGLSADHRLALRTSEVAAFAGLLVDALARLGLALPGPVANVARDLASGVESHRAFAAAAARDLISGRGAGLIAVGEHQPSVVHALALFANEVLGNLGKTVVLTEPLLLDASNERETLSGLADALRGNAVDRLLIVGGNPVYSAPSDLAFGELIARAKVSAYVGLRANETSCRVDAFLPARHELESWGDALAFDGTVSLVQPLIRPLYEGSSLPEVLSLLLGEATSDHRLVRESYQVSLPGLAWDEALQRGFVPETKVSPSTVHLDPNAVAALRPSVAASSPTAIEVHWRVDNKVDDGRFAGNPWLQELPDPITKLAWGNAALIGPTLAARMHLEDGAVVRLERGGRAVDLPVLVVPGHADGSVTLPIGYGQASFGAKVDEADIGVNVLPLLDGSVKNACATARIERTDQTVALAITQRESRLEGRAPARTRTLSDVRAEPAIAGPKHRLPTLYDAFNAEERTGPQWGMVIDLSACTGCSACVVACQAENNVPVVGRSGVLQRREMHWLRIDRYFTGGPANPGVLTQPMLCQHCEKAPCEYVCPVNATTHSPDGLNEMTYNRCVGTRFCQNNCPYKVRRFNWFDYTARTPPTMRLAMNPEVTVRARGVIEKCTFCVQRIRTTQQRAIAEGREGERLSVQTACQQACPTRAIVFGDLSDPTSEVSKESALPSAYRVLEDLGTNPRVRYLTRIQNPNPELG